jgi:hypothetical protein
MLGIDMLLLSDYLYLIEKNILEYAIFFQIGEQRKGNFDFTDYARLIG